MCDIEEKKRRATWQNNGSPRKLRNMPYMYYRKEQVAIRRYVQVQLVLCPRGRVKGHTDTEKTCQVEDTSLHIRRGSPSSSVFSPLMSSYPRLFYSSSKQPRGSKRNDQDPWKLASETLKWLGLSRVSCRIDIWSHRLGKESHWVGRMTPSDWKVSKHHRRQ